MSSASRTGGSSCGTTGCVTVLSGSVAPKVERLVDRRERSFQVWAYAVAMGRLLLRGEDRFFCLESANRIGYIVAGVMVSQEDTGEFFDPSPLWADLP